MLPDRSRVKMISRPVAGNAGVAATTRGSASAITIKTQATQRNIAARDGARRASPSPASLSFKDVEMRRPAVAAEPLSRQSATSKRQRNQDEGERRGEIEPVHQAGSRSGRGVASDETCAVGFGTAIVAKRAASSRWIAETSGAVRAL